jgi:hypothetical protein
MVLVVALIGHGLTSFFIDRWGGRFMELSISAAEQSVVAVVGVLTLLSQAIAGLVVGLVHSGFLLGGACAVGVERDRDRPPLIY